MVSRVRYRPFEDDDLDAVASILRPEWHTRSEIEEYNHLEAEMDLAYCLSTSTFSQVALIDGVPQGIVLARAEGERATDADRWLKLEAQLFERLRELDERAAEWMRSYTRSSLRVNNGLLEQSGVDRGAEIVLLAVGRGARHLGIGSVLIDAATSYCADRSAQSLYLFTDTSCSWQFYEHHGLKRVAAHRCNREERRVLAREMYLYHLDLSA